MQFLPSPPSSGETSESVAEQAATWIVRLTSDCAADREHARAGFDAWKAADPRHAREAARMEGVVGQVQELRERNRDHGPPARAALDAALSQERKRGRLRRAMTTLAIALVMGGPALLAWRAYPSAYLMADVRTATGQWQTQTLPDGTSITLGSASAVNLHYDPHRRSVELLSGEILVEVAHDALRPFTVETPHGSIRALGTRFTVSLLDGAAPAATVLTMLESKVSVRPVLQRSSDKPQDAPVSAVVGAGQRLRIDAQGLGALEAVDGTSLSHAWEHHQLLVQDRPLPEVLEALGRYRSGHIRFDASRLQGIRVSAVLPLDDTDRALQLLVAGLPSVRVRTFTPYFVVVDVPHDR